MIVYCVEEPVREVWVLILGVGRHLVVEDGRYQTAVQLMLGTEAGYYCAEQLMRDLLDASILNFTILHHLAEIIGHHSRAYHDVAQTNVCCPARHPAADAHHETEADGWKRADQMGEDIRGVGDAILRRRQTRDDDAVTMDAPQDVGIAVVKVSRLVVVHLVEHGARRGHLDVKRADPCDAVSRRLMQCSRLLYGAEGDVRLDGFVMVVQPFGAHGYHKSRPMMEYISWGLVKGVWHAVLKEWDSPCSMTLRLMTSRQSVHSSSVSGCRGRDRFMSCEEEQIGRSSPAQPFQDALLPVSLRAVGVCMFAVCTGQAVSTATFRPARACRALAEKPMTFRYLLPIG